MLTEVEQEIETLEIDHTLLCTLLALHATCSVIKSLACDKGKCSVIPVN